MAKVLLKHVENKPNKQFQRNIAKIVSTTLTVKANFVPLIEMSSYKALINKNMESSNKGEKIFKDLIDNPSQEK